MPVQWDFARGPVPREDVDRLEAEWGVRFPDDYVACVLEYNAGTPEPSAVAIPGWGRTLVNRLLDVNEPDRERVETMRRSYQPLKRFLPEGVYPFGNDPGGNAFCFDFRNADPAGPRVVLWDHERAEEEDCDRALHPVAESFTQLIGMFREIDDD